MVQVVWELVFGVLKTEVDMVFTVLLQMAGLLLVKQPLVMVFGVQLQALVLVFMDVPLQIVQLCLKILMQPILPIQLM